MLKKIMIAALAASALSFTAPGALADDPPPFDCGFDSNQQDEVTGQNYEGVIYGYIAHEGGVSITCTIRVNGADVAGGTATGTNAAVLGQRITFTAEDTDVVELCYTYSTPHGTGSGCYGTTHIEIPPQVVWDTIDGASCPVLASLAGSHAGGLVEIDSEGDVYVAGEPQWDCPPYDIWPPS